MNLFVRAIIAILLGSCSSALAFENIETDALYDGVIKAQIMDEFTLGLKMLKAQANGLGMAVREKDLKTLQQNMYDKALLMGQCVDKATTLKKTASDKILFDKNVKECISMHLKFIDWLKTAKGREWQRWPSSCTQYWPTSVAENAPYDFLGFEKSTRHLAYDYLALRGCYENSPERQTEKLLEKSLRKP
jgi:hypothetical protein